MKPLFIMTIGIILSSAELKANITGNSELIFQSDTIRARPINGLKEFYSKWSSQAKYSKEARKNGIEGRIHIRFMVNEDGTLSDFEVRKSLGYGLDEITIAAIKKCGQWNPTKINGIAVKEEMIIPFTFKLKR